ncbi:MAG: SRPBCC family protein [Pseudomonadales bacterium]
MAIIELSADYDCAPAALWHIIGDPSRADWVPSVSSCVYDGECRTLNMAGAGELVERIFVLDAQQQRIEYGVVKAPVEMALHRAAMQLSATDNGTRLDWRTEVEPDAYAGFIRDGMEAGIEGLRQALL